MDYGEFGVSCKFSVLIRFVVGSYVSPRALQLKIIRFASRDAWVVVVEVGYTDFTFTSSYH